MEMRNQMAKKDIRGKDRELIRTRAKDYPKHNAYFDLMSYGNERRLESALAWLDELDRNKGEEYGLSSLLGKR
jgi:hypothetical protein